MAKGTFYHAGCPVCVDAEQVLVGLLSKDAVEVEIVHLGTEAGRVTEAEKLGVKSVPALVVDGNVYHINFGASIEDLK
jgi:glutaredoxin